MLPVKRPSFIRLLRRLPQKRGSGGTTQVTAWIPHLQRHDGQARSTSAILMVSSLKKHRYF
jgi:hypothetical protein